MIPEPLHIKLEYSEALNSKKGFLFSQENLLRTLREINNYRSLRTEELKLKTRFYKKTKEAITEIKKIEKTLPNPKIPALLKKENDEGYQFERKIRETKNNYDKDIEAQLLDIQEKLRSLQI